MSFFLIFLSIFISIKKSIFSTFVSILSSHPLIHTSHPLIHKQSNLIPPTQIKFFMQSNIFSDTQDRNKSKRINIFIYLKHFKKILQNGLFLWLRFKAYFYEWGSTVFRLHCHYDEEVYFQPLTTQEFLVLIWSALKGWKTDLNLGVTSWYKPVTPGLLIHRPNH